MAFDLNEFLMPNGSVKVRHFTTVGGYPLYYITADGGVLSPSAVEENLDLCRDPSDSQWHVIGADVNWEDPCLICDHTGNRIESAYAEDECPACDAAYSPDTGCECNG